MKLKNTLSLAAIALAALAGTSQAAVTFSGVGQSTAFTVDATSPLTIVNADISYNTGENNAVGGYDWGVLNDQSLVNTTVIDGDGGGVSALIWKMTAGASDIGSISVYSDWSNTGRLEQHYTVSYTTDAVVGGGIQLDSLDHREW